MTTSMNENQVLSFSQRVDQKILDGKVQQLTMNEIETFLDEHWLEYTCRNNLSPCGDLTLKGRRDYFEANLEEIQGLIREFPLGDNNNE